ncbi:tRNA (guanosine(37)-N1)-methyltransferase TrmD [Candidatus Saccharibacteria bacterium]|nr:tRNA (guanosine(37)-N1)-methyltransferase TrmD [Candidatus Saccharibacteria bacterium]
MKIIFISIFPDMIKPYFETSMMRKASEQSIAEFEYVNLRDFGTGPRSQVDDMPYGGGDGMILQIEPLSKAIEATKLNSLNAKVLLTAAGGVSWRQSRARQIAADNNDLIIICGRYEGIDERVMQYVDETVSIGQYVLTGGELAAMVISDSVVRLLDGVLGGETSASDESFEIDEDYVEFPQYTRPADFGGMRVPKILLSGDHQKIADWRHEQSKIRSKARKQV